MCSFLVASFLMAASTLKYANYYLRLRGPDYTNKVEERGWTFVHNLLSMTGDFTLQPFKSKDGKVVTLFNGEIYNYQELGLGTFPSDGYALIPAYEKYGEDFGSHLHGEYAIVLSDFEKMKTFIISDTFCTKPVWYAIWDDPVHGKRFATASYQSALTRMGAPDEACVFVHPNTRVTVDMSRLEVAREDFVFSWNLTQYKMDTSDWEKAFKRAIDIRTRNVKHKIFIGLSDGYDSGAIMLALSQAGVDFMSYTVSGKEDAQTIRDRIVYKSGIHTKTNNYSYRPCVMFPSDIKPYKERTWLNTHVEPYNYTYNGFREPLLRDKACIGLSSILTKVRTRGGLIYLSGSGADEIMTDYAMDGKRIYSRKKSFNGIFPHNLSSIFPWTCFYLGTQRDYLMKEELVGGAHGIETRYPFLDRFVVQEFLYLHESLKNEYKRPLDDYFSKFNFPFRKKKKMGFNLVGATIGPTLKMELESLSKCG
jgi:asparagine synthetase B (glutamine-hydrolysing)